MPRPRNRQPPPEENRHGRTVVKTEVFVEPGRVTSDGNPLRYVELRHRFVRPNRRFSSAYGLVIVIVVIGLSSWAFVALSAWSF